MSSHKIDILLPTYNGSKYIRVLLDSLLDQTYTDWHLFVRDDHSKDDTVAIVNEYALKFPGKITLLDDGLGNLGINKNFSTLLGISKADYACFCDQDDKWMPDKLEISLAGIQKLEKEIPNKPCLFFSNLCLVDDELNVIHESHWEHENLNPDYITLNKLLVQSPINGCVMIMNRSLIELANPVPPEAMWFDHWVSTLAGATGKLGYIDRTTIWYRIHDNNASRGENRVTKTKDEDQLKRKITNKNFKVYFEKLENQAKAVKKRMLERGLRNTQSEQLIDTFVNLRKQNPVARKLQMVKHGFFKHSAKGTLKWLIRI